MDQSPAPPPFPADAADYVDDRISRRAIARLINEFNHGGYLAWRLGDRYQTFLDGRTQLFAPEFAKTYLGSRPDAAAIILQAGADVAIIPAARAASAPSQ